MNAPIRMMIDIVYEDCYTCAVLENILAWTRAQRQATSRRVDR